MTRHRARKWLLLAFHWPWIALAVCVTFLGGLSNETILSLAGLVLAFMSCRLLLTGYVEERQRRRRKRSGLCVRCGYDLRASKDCCPECGLVISLPDVHYPGEAEAVANIR